MKNSMIYLRQWLAVCALIVSLAACNNDDNDASGGNVTLVSPIESIQCMAEQSTHTITFTADGDWAVVPSRGWLKTNLIQGAAGEQAIELTIAENQTFEERTGTVVVKDKLSGRSIEVPVKQAAMNALFLFDNPTTELAIDSKNRLIVGSVRVTSNYDWAIKIPSAAWLTYKIVETVGNTSTVMFYANPDKLESYDAIEAHVNFDYVATATRAPGSLDYVVLFPGVKPKLELDIERAELEDPWEEGAFKARLVVNSNIAWDFATLPDFLEAAVNDGNFSARFFDVESVVFLTLKDEKLDTDELNGQVKFLDTFTKEEMADLPVYFKGLGANYVSFDSSVFQSSDPIGGGAFLFDAIRVYDDSWNQTNLDKMEKTILVKAADADDIAVYCAKAFSPWADPEQIEYWSAGADPVVSKTRSVVNGYPYSVWVKDRNDDWGDMNKSEVRYFTLFVVSKKNAPTFDDLFDAEGMLKDEFRSPSNKVTLGQKGIQITYTFWSEQLTEGQEFVVSGKGETYDIYYESDAEFINLFTNVKPSDDGFVDGDLAFDSEVVSVNFVEPGFLKLTVKPNSTDEERLESCAFGAYVEGQERDQLLVNFKIKQAAK